MLANKKAALLSGGGNVAPTLDLDFSKTPQIDSRLTCSRSTTASVVDFEGLVKTAKINEVRFPGARRVENLVTYSQAFTNAVWSKSPGIITTGVADPFSGNNAYTYTATSGMNQLYATFTSIAGHTYVASYWVKRRTGTGRIDIYVLNGTNITSVLTTSWQRFSVKETIASATAIYSDIIVYTNGDAIDIYGFQLEDVTGQANQAASEYVSTNVLSAPYYGANVDGVKYFTTTNGNTVTNNVVTESTGAALTNGITLLQEEARTNINTYSENIVTGNYTTTPTLTRNQLAPDGTSTASLMTGSGTSATQRFYKAAVATTANAVYTGSCFIKAGTSQYVTLQCCNSAAAHGYQAIVDTTTMTFVNTTNTVGQGTFISRSISPPLANGFYRVSVTGSFNDTSTVIRAALTNDGNTPVPTYSTTQTAIVWGMQLELGSSASSYTPTTTAAVTRAVDSASFTGTGLSSWYNPTQGTFAITASGAAFNAPYNLGALTLTYSSQSKYLLGYNNNTKSGCASLYTADTVANPTEYTGISVPTTVYVNSAGIANISKFTYYPKILKPSKMPALL